MLRPLSSRVLPAIFAVGLFALACPAHAQEAQPQPPPQLAPLPPSQPPTVIVQQYPPGQYPQAPYGQPMYPPGYQPVQPYYVPQQPTAPSTPRIIHDWDDSQPVPAGYHKEERIRKGLVIGGAVMFGTTYLLSALVASIDADAYSGQSNPCAGLWVPAIGPFITMTQSNTATGDFFLALDGLAQIGGLAMFTVGLAYPKSELVRNDFGILHDLKLAPIVSRDHGGMGLVGTF